ncbi:MAG: ABC transporter permease [Deltaproteobacteria bacterium]|nr:ABC transporter permease [Deltaproteobacteria bacterium]
MVLSFLLIVLRNVLRNRRRSLITAGAIVLGVCALVAVRGFTEGFHAATMANMAEGRLGALVVHHPRYLISQEQAPLDLDLPGDEAFLARIVAVPGVAAGTPRLTFTSAVNVGDETVFAQISAVDPRRELATLKRAKDMLAEGRAIEGAGECLLGLELARTLRAKLGDTITFLSNDREGVLNGAEAKLVGLLSFKTAGDRRVAQLALPTADQLLRMNGRVTEYAVAIDGDLEGADLLAAQSRLQEALGAQARVSTWSEIASWLTDMILFQRVMYAIIGLVLVVVVLTGIANTMLMSVLERVREIGTMMALGVRRRQIVGLFLAESALLGFLAGVVGAALGSLVVFWLHRRGLDFPPPGTTIHNIVRPTIGLGYNLFAVGLSTVGATLAAVYPAWRAAQLRPVEALSHV